MANICFTENYTVMFQKKLIGSIQSEVVYFVQNFQQLGIAKQCLQIGYNF